jgi:hypothetical protein
LIIYFVTAIIGESILELIYQTIPWSLPSKNYPSITVSESKNLPNPDGF